MCFQISSNIWFLYVSLSFLSENICCGTTTELSNLAASIEYPTGLLYVVWLRKFQQFYKGTLKGLIFFN